MKGGMEREGERGREGERERGREGEREIGREGERERELKREHPQKKQGTWYIEPFGFQGI